MAQPPVVTELEVKKARPQDKTYKILLGRGFWLDVSPLGVKSWRQSVRQNGQQRLMTLGRYPDMSLKEANAKAEANRVASRVKFAGGHDGVKPVRRTKIFKEAAKDYLLSHKGTWSKVHYHAVGQFISEMCNGYEDTLGKGFGETPIGSVTKKQVLVIVDGALARGAHGTARDILMYLKAILVSYNGRQELKDKINLDRIDIVGIKQSLPPPRRRKSMAAIDIWEMPKFLWLLNQLTRSAVRTKIATQMLLLTGVRTKELRQMQLNQINFDRKEWIIPAAEMKNRLEHIVPLSDKVIRLLSVLRAEQDALLGSDPRKNAKYVFYGDRNPNATISENTVLEVIEKIGYKGRQTGHGFRTLFSTWGNSKVKEGNWTKDAIELQLSHVDGDKVRGAYNKYQYFDERRALMDAWAKQIEDWEIEGIRGN